MTNHGTGAGTATQWTDEIIASKDDTLGDADDVVLASYPHIGALPIGGSYSQSRTILLPPAFEGRYHIFVEADGGNQVFENGQRANKAAEAPNPVDVMPIPYADLVVSQLAVPSADLTGQSLHVAWQVTNQGIGPTNVNSWSDAVSLASDAAGQDIVAPLGEFEYTGGLDKGGTYGASLDASLPNLAAGTYSRRRPDQRGWRGPV